jgi:esterase/lipase superfamily enzyme
MEEAEAKYLNSNNTLYQSILRKTYHETHKQSHKKKCRKQAKQRYNRKKALEKRSERILCKICGYDVAKNYFQRHLATQRHKKNETELGYEGSDEEPCITPSETSE